MTEQVVYSFDKQLELGKLGEQAVYQHLRSKQNVVMVRDLSTFKDWQVLGIDAMLVYEGTSGILYASFFDVKTDFQVHKTGNLFIETSSSEDKKGCMLTTKSEQFLYYDPILGKLYHLPIFVLRRRYNEKGISKKHITVQNKTYTGEGILVTLDELQEIIPDFEIENITPLNIPLNSLQE